MRFSGLLCGIRAKICSEKTWLKFVAMSAFNIPSPCPLPQEGGEVRAAALVKQGGLKSTAHSRYARKHKDSHTNPLCKDA